MERIYDSCERLIDIYIVFYDKRQQKYSAFHKMERMESLILE